MSVLYVPPAIVFFDYVRKNAIESELEELKGSLESVFTLVESLQYAGFSADICNQLKSEARAERIAFFSYRSKEASCSIPDDLTPESFPTEPGPELYTSKSNGTELTYSKRNFSDSVISIGFQKPKEHSLGYYVINSKNVLTDIFIELLLVMWFIIATFVIVVYFNLQRTKQILTGSSRKQSFLHKAASIFATDDIQTLKQVSSEIKTQLDKLESGEMYIETNLQYSVLAEIKNEVLSGNKVTFPISFEGTVVRVDINGYSQIMQTMTLEKTREINVSFKSIAAELAYRYKGLFENSAGDEVVYCFRGENRIRRGMAFIRDLSIEFSEAMESKGLKLFVKGSVYDSPMLMDLGMNRLEFDGLSLLYTNRMFGSLEIKDQNVMILPSELYLLGNEFGLTSNETHISAKGMKLSVHYITSFHDHTDPELLKSDKHIEALLNRVHTETESSFEEILNLGTSLRLKKSSDRIKFAWISAVKFIISKNDLRQTMPQYLPTLISLGPVLLPNQWDDECSNIVKQATELSQERVSENAIDALLKLDLYNVAAGISVRKGSKRLVANGLLAEALARPTNANVKRLRMLASSSSIEEKASGLFASAQLVDIYRKKKIKEGIVLSEYKELIKILKSELSKTKSSPRVLSKIREALDSL
ncbi:hypothetical protein [Bdellovibrio sp. ArHS]|uniref:hypothetical protein n=1 Tax=Bdellovibrio sp. ArHS TaxID=1569284 RepID=UPI0025BE52CF|nr:hypothetical protein [Bdellovibrio sp. ArHS]